MKKLFSLIISMFMVCSLAACGTSGSGGGTLAGENSGDFPNETITMVCPFSAGGGTDVGARYMAASLSKLLGVNVVVENQIGSGGWVAWTDLIQGDYSDGYTIGLINQNYATGEIDPDNPRAFNLDNIKVLANQAIDYNVMAIRADETRFTDMMSFIEYAKSNPVMISAQATGITDGDATTAEWFNKTFGTQIIVVPVDGAADSRGMLLAGDTDVFFASISDVVVDYQNGQMDVLCLFAEERSKILPDVATIAEATGKNYVAFAARGYFYPAGVSEEKVEIMTAALLKAMEDSDYKKSMESLGLQLDSTSGEAYKELLASQVKVRRDIWDS